MKIDLKWDKPFPLKDGSKTNQIYCCAGLETFFRQTGRLYIRSEIRQDRLPAYVGQPKRLRSRIEGQFNNLRLMVGIKNAQNGRRILLIGRLRLHSGQRKKKVLDIAESALIKRALAEGHDLLNQQGTKTKVHSIKSEGNSSSRQIASLTILVERKHGN